VADCFDAAALSALDLVGQLDGVGIRHFGSPLLFCFFIMYIIIMYFQKSYNIFFIGVWAPRPKILQCIFYRRLGAVQNRDFIVMLDHEFSVIVVEIINHRTNTQRSDVKFNGVQCSDERCSVVRNNSNRYIDWTFIGDH